jgi:hypothetical protein
MTRLSLVLSVAVLASFTSLKADEPPDIIAQLLDDDGPLLSQPPYPTQPYPGQPYLSQPLAVPPPPAPPADWRLDNQQPPPTGKPTPVGPLVPNGSVIPLVPQGAPSPRPSAPAFSAPGSVIPLVPQGAQPPLLGPGTTIPLGPQGAQPQIDGTFPFQEGNAPGSPDLSRLRMTETPNSTEMVTGEPEAPPPAPALVFRTRDVLRADVLKGPNYRLGEYAPLVNFRFRFELETPWGTIPVHGMAMLELRLRELHAIEYASRISNKNPMWVEGVWQVGAETPEGAYILVTDPVGSFYRTAVALKRIAMAKTSPGGVRANCEPRRRIACLIGCDPETRNPVLQCLLDTMSTNATTGWLAADAALNFGFPGIGTLAANAEFKRMMAIPSSSEVNAQLDTQLRDLGISQKVRTTFLNCAAYTMTQRMATVYWLQNLVGIDGLTSLVQGAGDAKDESEALESMQEIQLIADLRRTRTIVQARFIGLPLIRLVDGSQMIVTADDYIVPTPAIAQLMSRYRQEFPQAPTTLVTLGRVSWEAEHELEGMGISVACHRLRVPTDAKAHKPTETALAPGTATPGPRTQ